MIFLCFGVCVGGGGGFIKNGIVHFHVLLVFLQLYVTVGVLLLERVLLLMFVFVGLDLLDKIVQKVRQREHSE